MRQYSKFVETIAARANDVDTEVLAEIARCFDELKAKPRKIVLVGNGGSAAIASHVAVDLTKAAGVRAINFNEADLLTCFANDYGYERWVEKAIEAYGDEGDAAVLISSSGRSPNIVNGALAARQRGLRVITLSGFDADNPLRSLGDVNLWVDSSSYNVVETVHQIWLLAVVEQLMADRANP